MIHIQKYSFFFVSLVTKLSQHGKYPLRAAWGMVETQTLLWCSGNTMNPLLLYPTAVDPSSSVDGDGFCSVLFLRNRRRKIALSKIQEHVECLRVQAFEAKRWILQKLDTLGQPPDGDSDCDGDIESG